MELLLRDLLNLQDFGTICDFGEQIGKLIKIYIHKRIYNLELQFFLSPLSIPYTNDQRGWIL